MRWAGHVARMGMGKACTRFRWGNLRERDHWGDPGVDGRIILTFEYIIQIEHEKLFSRLKSQSSLCAFLMFRLHFPFHLSSILWSNPPSVFRFSQEIFFDINFNPSNWRIKKPTGCHLLFYFTSYRLNMFRALLCPSSGARDYNVDYHIGRFVLGLL